MQVEKGLKKSPKIILYNFERLLKVYSTHKILQQKCKNSCKRLQKVTKGNKKYIKKLQKVTNSYERSTKCIEVQVAKIHKMSQKAPICHNRSKKSQKVTKICKIWQKVAKGLLYIRERLQKSLYFILNSNGHYILAKNLKEKVGKGHKKSWKDA